MQSLPFSSIDTFLIIWTICQFWQFDTLYFHNFEDKYNFNHFHNDNDNVLESKYFGISKSQVSQSFQENSRQMQECQFLSKMVDYWPMVNYIWVFVVMVEFDKYRIGDGQACQSTRSATFCNSICERLSYHWIWRYCRYKAILLPATPGKIYRTIKRNDFPIFRHIRQIRPLMQIYGENFEHGI